jgi:tetratricopeptide (TPR) repeat protein
MFRINVSGGELFELIRPTALVLSALLATWVLASALKRFTVLTSLLWAIATFFLPLIAGAIYLAFIILRSRKSPSPRSRGRRWLWSLAYGTVLLSSIGIYLYADKRSADAHFARASQAKLTNNHALVISEYRNALKVEDNAHTHKLLAIQLAEAGMLQEAVAEFRLAQSGGEPDDSISYQLGVLLEKLNRPEEARVEYRRFIKTESCTRSDPDNRCRTAETLVKPH